MISNPAIFNELDNAFQRTDNLLDELVSIGPTEDRCAELENSILDTGNILSEANRIHPHPKQFALIMRELKAHLKKTHEFREKITRPSPWNSH